MANKLIMKCSVEPQIDASDTVVDSVIYQSYHTDNVGSHGGTLETTYTDARAIKYVGVVDKKTAFTNSSCAYNDDPTVTMDSTTGLIVGMSVSGSGIPSGAYVASITNATTFELSAATTGGNKSSQTLTFSGATPLSDGDLAFEGTATATGTEPSASGVKAFYVKYDSTLGTVASVTVTYGSQAMAVLGVGESVLVPLSGGTLADCKIHASAYTSGTHEATVTVVLIGD